MSQLAEMTQSHVQHLATDYVLGLLSAEERKSIEEHSVECAACREVILNDRRLAGSVRIAILSATQPTAVRLQQLMPQPPGSAKNAHLIRAVRLPGVNRSAVLAFCVLVFLLSAGSVLFGGYRSQRAGSPTSVATQLAATATGPAVTATAVPSATSIESAGKESGYLSESLRQSPSPAAPRPISTPVASASQSRSPAYFP